MFLVAAYCCLHVVLALELSIRCDVQGQAGNAVQYITRNQALKKLQLRLSEFRCSHVHLSGRDAAAPAICVCNIIRLFFCSTGGCAF